MLMDISAWTRYNPKIVQEHTTKKFYGRYLYRLVVFCPAGRAIDSKRDIKSEIAHRTELSKNIKGWWGERMARNLNNANPEFLERMRVLRHQKGPEIKMRIEEPQLQIYADSENQLENIIKTYFDQGDYRYIKSISGPKDITEESILNTGAIIRKKNVGYNYKVILKDAKYSQELKNGLLQYLSNLGTDTVKIPNSFSHMLQTTSIYIWNAYFYTNDPSIVTFINLMYPGLVSNIHEIVIVPAK